MGGDAPVAFTNYVQPTASEEACQIQYTIALDDTGDDQPDSSKVSISLDDDENPTQMNFAFLDLTDNTQLYKIYNVIVTATVGSIA